VLLLRCPAAAVAVAADRQAGWRLLLLLLLWLLSHC
jgi:hypothetical protein